ncbi:hypothetical protein C8R45DRAFT_1002068 [Mycena sanguinolenta]|nr:hypothetical protein C8R45DRAFT_1002068 [Mycena sanguinolenta]
MSDHSHDGESERISRSSTTQSLSLSGAFFPNSSRFVLSGGTFISHNTTETPPSDFLRIPLGNIDLRNEIRLDKAGDVVRSPRTPGGVRQMYSARVAGHNEPMTVALYEGDHAAQEWRHSVSCHSGLRWEWSKLNSSDSSSTLGIPTSFKFTLLRVQPEYMLRYHSFSRSTLGSEDEIDLIPFKQFLDAPLILFIHQTEACTEYRCTGCIPLLQADSTAPRNVISVVDSPFNWTTLHRSQYF